MADVEAVAAESSPAATAFEIPTDSEGYSNWRTTGELPAKPKAASKESTPAPGESAPPSEKTAPASEPGKHTQEAKPRSTAETRLNELLADLKKAGLSPAELKTFKREAQREAQADDKPKAASETTAKPAASTELKPPDKPDRANWKGTWEELEAAMDKYHEDMAEFKAQVAVQKARQEDAQKAETERMQQKLEDAKKRYGAEAEPKIIETAQAVFGDKEVSNAVKIMLGSSDIITDLVYVMGSDAAEFAEFISLAKSNPAAAVRKLVLVEKLTKDELAKGASGKQATPAEETGTPARGEDGKFLPAEAPAKAKSKAPPPPGEVSGRASAPPDEVTSAIAAHERGDPQAFTRFRDAENRKEIARRKGR
jgi:hypothetical protein